MTTGGRRKYPPTRAPLWPRPARRKERITLCTPKPITGPDARKCLRAGSPAKLRQPTGPTRDHSHELVVHSSLAENEPANGTALYSEYALESASSTVARLDQTKCGGRTRKQTVKICRAGHRSSLASLRQLGRSWSDVFALSASTSLNPLCPSWNGVRAVRRHSFA